MTYYFDETDRQLSIAKTLPAPEQQIRLREIEEKLVFDVSVCIMMDGFPTELRIAANKVMLERAVECRPVNSPDNPRIAEWHDHVEELREMSCNLHTIFHRVVNEWEIPGLLDNGACFSDDPTRPLRALATLAEAEREEMVESRNGATTTTPDEPSGTS